MKPAGTMAIRRRTLIKGAVTVLGDVLLAGCAGPPPLAPTPGPTIAPPTPTASPSALQTPTDPLLSQVTRTPVPLASPTTTHPSEQGAFRLVGYLASWKLGGSYRIADVPADKLTHLIYAFAVVSATGECTSANNRLDEADFSELLRLKEQNLHLQTLISIGGGSGPGHFPLAARSPADHERFARSAIGFVKQYGFDGIDVDWEYPNGAEQKRGLILLLAELRRQLDDLGKRDDRRYLLTVASSAGPTRFVDYAVADLYQSTDWLNVMSYAFHETWSSITNFDAPLYATAGDPSADLQRAFYNTNFAVQAYLALGVPPDKLVVGVPFFGYGWKGVPDVNHGLFQPTGGLPPGTLAPGVFEYRDLKENYLSSYPRFWHEEAQVPWLYDPSTGVMITYDDPESVGAKASYVRSQGLGGAMIWELTADDRQHSLVSALAAKLTAPAV